MKAAAFDYVAPRSLADAVAALAGGGDEARVIAGGQSLGPMLNLRLARPGLLIDITRLPELKRVEDRGDAIFIGAVVTHATLEDGRYALADGGMLASVAHGIAYRSVRNRGTIGGSLAHADPAADWVTVLTALDADLIIASIKGSRRGAMRGFMRGAFATALETGEIIEGVLLPKRAVAARWGYYKICRKPGEFADAMCAVMLDPGRRGCRIVAGANSGAPAVLDELAARVASDGITSATPPTIAAALTTASPQLDATDIRVHAVAVSRALKQVFAA